MALVLEDVHWADPATLAALRTIAGRLQFVALAVVLTFRPTPQSRALSGLLAHLVGAGATELSLGPLDTGAVERLVTDALGTAADERLLGFVRGAGGNPLYVSMLLDALAREGVLSLEDGRMALRAESLPPDLRRTILRRLSFLSGAAIEVLRFAAVLGSSFAPSDLATVMGRPLADLLPAVNECVAARLVEEDGAALRFRHDLIREALYGDFPEPVRIALHAEAARALAASGAPLSTVARHYATGAMPGDRESIDALRRAALTAEQSPSTAIELLERAGELARPLPDLRDEIRAELAEALVDGGRPDDGEAVARDLLRRRFASDTGERMRNAIVRALWFGARYRELVEMAGGWLVSPELGDAERGRLLAASALGRAIPIGGSLADALGEAGEALSIGDRLESDHVRFYALRALSHVHGRMGQSPEQLDAARRAVALAEHDRTGELFREHPHVTLAQAYSEVAFRDSYALGGGRYQEMVDSCEHILTEGLRLREELGSLSALPAYLTLLATLRYRQRRFDDALAEVEAAVAAAAETGTRVGLVQAHLVAGQILVVRGEVERAEHHIAEAEAIVHGHGNQSNDPRKARAQLHFLRGQWTQAANLDWEIFQDQRPEDATWSPYGTVFALVQAGRIEEARAVIEHAEAWAKRTDSDEAAFQARLARALAHSDVEWLSQALFSTKAHVPGGDSGVWLMASGVLAQAGRMDDATRFFKRSIEHVDPADPETSFMVESYAAIARSCGLRVRIPRRPRRATSGWDALTDTERRVVDLAAQGLTNPQIGERLYLSRRTVQTHLTHVFRKLGISSRVELVAELSRRRT